MSEDEDNSKIAEFSKRCYCKIGEAGNELRRHGTTRGLSRVEIAIAIACACVRLQAVAIFGAEVNPTEFEGYLEKNLEDLKQRYAEGADHAKH